MGCGGSKAKQSGMKIVTPADAATRRKTVKSTGEVSVGPPAVPPNSPSPSSLTGKAGTSELFSGEVDRGSRYSWRTSHSNRSNQNALVLPSVMVVQSFNEKLWNELHAGDKVLLTDLPEGTADLNRYENILPNPSTRVLLSTDDASGDSQSYINANYIRGARLTPNEAPRPRCYIATQGPTPQTVNHFWRMVWQEQSTVIIMVTGLSEKGRKKCERYWPEEHRVMECAGITITSLSAKIRGGVTLTNLELSQGGVTRVVYHFWHTEWPDHTKPTSASSVGIVLQMVATARRLGRTSEAPWVVHCSAGVGRSGTIIAIDYGIDMLTSQAHCDVPTIIRELRRDRAHMVASFEQARFAADALELYADVYNQKLSIMATPGPDDSSHGSRSSSEWDAQS